MDLPCTKWSAIVLTCQNKNSADAYQQELISRRDKFNFGSKNTTILAIEDPDCPVGSGGATLNALLILAEHFSAQEEFNVVNADVFHNKYVLIIHMGRSYPFDTCNRSFVTIPNGFDKKNTLTPTCNLDIIINTVTGKLAKNAPPGAWVCSSDMLINIDNEVDGSIFKHAQAFAVTFEASINYAKNHGVLKCDSNNIIQDMFYQTDEDTLISLSNEQNMVDIISGIVFFNFEIIQCLISLINFPPLDGCTYLGLDSGAEQVKINLVFDILLVMCSEISWESYANTSMNRNRKLLASGDNIGHWIEYNCDNIICGNVLATLWKCLKRFDAKNLKIDEGFYSYLDLSPVTLHNHILKLNNNKQNEYCSNAEVAKYSNCETVKICSDIQSDVLIGSNSVISLSNISSYIEIGSNCFIMGFPLTDFQDKESPLKIRDNTHVYRFHVKLKNDVPSHAVVAFSSYDSLTLHYRNAKSSIFNSPWDNFFTKTGLNSQQLWPENINDSQHCFMTAKLFTIRNDTNFMVDFKYFSWFGICSYSTFNNKSDFLNSWLNSIRYSLQDILSIIDHSEELMWRKQIFYNTCVSKMKDIIKNHKAISLTPIFNDALIDGFHPFILSALDDIAIRNSDNYSIVARCFTNIAIFLGLLSENKGGVLGGSANNKSWRKSSENLVKGNVKNGIISMRKERNANWLSRPDLMVRAARHYEGAAQIMIRKVVSLVDCFIKAEMIQKPPVGVWIVSEAPARLDFSGAWSDTPPQTYEHGGKAVMLGVKIDGMKSIGAKVRIIESLKIVVFMSDIHQTISLEFDKLADLKDYCKPSASGALIKAALITAKIININGSELKEQLLKNVNGGLEIVSWAKLPHGSGLGTSSILGSTILSCLYRITGVVLDHTSLIHSVLLLEQILTTGGGWQDQVGGIIPGLKMGKCKPEIPLHVEVEHINASSDFLNKLENHLVLVYTGKTRLAKNLLQSVIRNWYARDSKILDLMDDIEMNSVRTANAIEKGDIELLGKYLNHYWDQKRALVTGCEPLAVNKFLTHLKNDIYGGCMTGAAGGGFLYILMKSSERKTDIVLNAIKELHLDDFTIHNASVDMEGLVVYEI